MRSRFGLSLAVLVAAACSGTDGPVGLKTPDITPSMQFEGVKPPPPIGSGDVEIFLDSPSSETPFSEGLVAGGPSAETVNNQPFAFSVHGRYFANSQNTNGWIQFESDEDCTASPNAKLQYDEKTHKTTGNGTITCDGITLALSKITITDGGFGDCTVFEGMYSCRGFSFTYDDADGVGFVNIGDFES